MRPESEPQLTFRALAMGAALGALMSLSNLYIGLKAGFLLCVSITSCILAFAVSKAFKAAGIFRTDMSLLESNIMQTTASSAGYSTGGTMFSGISACLILTGAHIAWPVLAAWTACLALLGVVIAIPLKRRMIDAEDLRFPSGVACAETLKGLHSGGGGGARKARTLGAAGVFGAALAWFRDAGVPFRVPASLGFGGAALAGRPLAQWTIQADVSAMLVGAGAIMGWRTGWSLLLGACFNYAVLAPWAVGIGAIDAGNLGYGAIVRWSTWAGSSLMVFSAFFSLASRRGAARGILSGLCFRGAAEEGDEVPGSWFFWGVGLAGLGCVWMLSACFGTRWWMGLLAVACAFPLAVAACRVTGETDATPVGAMGKVTQLMFGMLAPSSAVTNIMTAGITSGAAGSAADLLTALKTGRLLGASPRKQFLAQLFGILAGTLAVVGAYRLLVPDASALGTPQWPAPVAQVWVSVARLFSSGLLALPPSARWGMAAGSAAGLAIPALESAFPRARAFLPSAACLGLAMVIPFSVSFTIFVGAALALALERAFPRAFEEHGVTASSGLIAGESLLGVGIALVRACGLLR